jgi:5,5'-dehydrodivanillate O-demethylase oxygenase subunit
MLTKEENELLTRVGPGTPAGELLRRYWHPIAVARELTEQNPAKLIRILGEDLVLFRDGKGRVGLLADRCSHRGVSLACGRVEERGIACAYHGWLYDVDGNCLECPAEPPESKFHLTVKHKAYPVQRFLGFHWAYMGPLPAPLIPKFDIWFRKDGKRGISVYPIVDCNWLQSMENSVDPAHLQILHLDTTRSYKAQNTTRGFIDEVADFQFVEIPFGIMKRRIFRSGFVDEHPLIFPNNLRQSNSTQFRVPIDDTHTWHVHILFEPTEDGSFVEPAEQDVPVEYLEAFKKPRNGVYPYARYTLHKPLAQDHMAWETAGPIADREHERLATSDRGIVFFRQLLRREIEKVQNGLDPIGVFREDHAMIDTKLAEAMESGQYGNRPSKKIWTLKNEDRRNLIGSPTKTNLARNLA